MQEIYGGKYMQGKTGSVPQEAGQAISPHHQSDPCREESGRGRLGRKSLRLSCSSEKFGNAMFPMYHYWDDVRC